MKDVRILTMVLLTLLFIPVFGVTATGSDTGNFTVGAKVIPFSGPAPLTVRFIDASSNATALYWVFGDGNSSVELNPIHTYYQVGSYNATHTVMNGNDSLTLPIEINVTSATVSNIVNNSSGNTSINNNTTTNNTVTNNTTATNTSSNGSECTCNNANNSSTSNTTTNITGECTNISSSPKPCAGNANLKVLCTGKAPHKVSFKDKSKSHVSTTWNVGDGGTVKSKNFTHIYKKPGKYLVKMSIKYTSGVKKIIAAGYIIVK